MAKWGKETVLIFELDQPLCTRTYASAPCTAVLGTTGAHKCYNTFKTCQDTDNYSASPLTLRFGRAQEDLLQYGPIIPSIISAMLTPGTINLGSMDRGMSSLGAREVLTITFGDHLHSDHQVDKYRLERLTGAASDPSTPFQPYTRGTFWTKWMARNPYHTNFRCRVYFGEIGQALEDMEVRHFVVSRITISGGVVTLTAKDLLSLVEARKAVAPFASKGELSAGLTIGGGSFTVLPAGIGNLDYAASGYVCISSEIIQYTRSGDTFTVVMRGALGTDADTHDDEDLVQQVLVYSAQQAHDILYDLFTTYGGVPGADIPFAEEWEVEGSYLPQLYTGRIAKPTPINELAGEICEQAGFTLWGDPVTGQIRLKALIASDVEHTITDNEWILDGTLKVGRDDNKRASQVWVYYAQKDPTAELDDRANYHSRVVIADLSAESDNEYGQSSIKEIFSRWIPQFGRTTAEATGNRLLTMFRNPPIEADFALHESRAEDMLLMKNFNLQVDEVVDSTGTPIASAHVPIEIERTEDQLDVRSQEVFFFIPPPPGTEIIIPIENHANNLNLLSIFESLYPAPDADTVVKFVVEPTIQIGSTSTSTPAMRTGVWPAGASVTLENNGRIQGKGGNGGNGGTVNSPTFNGSNGSNGGTAILVENDIFIDNQFGEIWGGGGGGGGGNGSYNFAGPQWWGGGGGGAGAGIVTASGGTAGGSQNVSGTPAAAGGNGDTDNGGLGGRGHFGQGGGGFANIDNAGHGGDGGGPGLDGNDAGPQVILIDGGTPGLKGLKGKYVDGDAFITWTNNGDRRGAVS